MNFTLTEREEAVRQEIREFFREEPPVKFASDFPGEYSWGDWSREFTRRIGEKGWISMVWPEEYGGQGRPLMEQFVMLEEMNYHKAPILSFMFIDFAARVNHNKFAGISYYAVHSF